ncbi:SA1362 family protein [Jeotgalibacillus sp. ET6]|uniref:SA1362 family protein n=1 Tax=Jeotgalibacillus sp. ET6 TaxID=3037260 RepID=UPI0024188053|nr:SA1362 family protein [Jeotgalibacillus sp. ET6]MDG5470778.1 SA1362 family protein [Jeotgalibacillus sp. ET6]
MNARMAVFYSVIALAIFGLAYTLITDPASLFARILTYAVIIGVIYLLYRLWTARKPGRGDQQAFKKAARQSKKRYGNPVSASKLKSTGKHPSSKKAIPLKKSSVSRLDGPKLTVIEGKKGKKKKKISL